MLPSAATAICVLLPAQPAGRHSGRRVGSLGPRQLAAGRRALPVLLGADAGGVRELSGFLSGERQPMLTASRWYHARTVSSDLALGAEKWASNDDSVLGCASVTHVRFI